VVWLFDVVVASTITAIDSRDQLIIDSITRGTNWHIDGSNSAVQIFNSFSYLNGTLVQVVLFVTSLDSITRILTGIPTMALIARERMEFKLFIYL